MSNVDDIAGQVVGALAIIMVIVGLIGEFQEWWTRPTEGERRRMNAQLRAWDERAELHEQAWTARSEATRRNDVLRGEE